MKTIRDTAVLPVAVKEDTALSVLAGHRLLV